MTLNIYRTNMKVRRREQWSQYWLLHRREPLPDLLPGSLLDSLPGSTSTSRLCIWFQACFWSSLLFPDSLLGSASASGLCFLSPALLLLPGSASGIRFRDPLPGSSENSSGNFSPSSLIQSEDYHLPLIVFLTIIEKSEWFFLLIGSSPEIISEKFCFSENRGG